MGRRRKTGTKRPIESYEHHDKQRANNPPVGLVTPDTDPDAGLLSGGVYSLAGGFWPGGAAGYRIYLPLVLRNHG